MNDDTTRAERAMEHLTSLRAALGPDFPEDEIAFLVPFISRFTLEDGADGDPPVHIELLSSAGGDSWGVRVGDAFLRSDGALKSEAEPMSLAAAHAAATAHLTASADDEGEI